MNISDRIVATIRTAVPGAVGYLIAKLIAEVPQVATWIEWFDTNLSDVLLGMPLAKALEAVAVGAAIAGYYWLARWVGERFPAVERILLGSAKTPIYTDKAVG